MPNSDAERIAKLEAKLDTLIESFEKRMDRLETSLSSSYVPRAEYEQRCQNIEQRLEYLYPGEHELKINTEHGIFSVDLWIKQLL